MLHQASNVQTASIAGRIRASIEATAALQRNQIAKIALQRASQEAEKARKIAQAHEFFNPVFEQATQGCLNIFSLLDNPDLQEIIRYTERKNAHTSQAGYYFNYFHLFMTENIGLSDYSDDDMRIYISLLSDGGINLYFESSEIGAKPVQVYPHHFKGVQSCINLELRQMICNWSLKQWHENEDSMQGMMKDYKNIPSPLSWEIPINHYRGSLSRFRLVALRALAQCARPYMLERYLQKALGSLVLT
jgi:hypothetical protein